MNLFTKIDKNDPLLMIMIQTKPFVVCSSPDCLTEEFKVFDLQRQHTVKQEIKKDFASQLKCIIVASIEIKNALGME